MKNSYFLLLFVLSIFTATAQDYLMSDNSISACSGTFYDTGGASGNYSAGETLTFTICPPFPNNKIQVDFTSFDLAVGDALVAYDGDSINAPLIGAYGSFLSPDLIEATNSNSSGCLTFVFTSNSSSILGTGWQASIFCDTDCQTITSSVTTIPAPNADGVLRICQGDQVSINESSSFSIDGSNSTSRFEVSDGREVDGQNADLIFDDEGVYKIDFVVTDSSGCRDMTLEDVVIYVSTTPDFSRLEANPTVVAPGETSVLSGSASATEFQNPEGYFTAAGQTLLPDGSGVVYTSCIDVFGLNQTTFTDASDLFNVFINIEHSYVGDLDIRLVAPNGTEVYFLEYPNGGGGRFLGEALDDNTNNPGIGYVYNFTELTTATQTLSQGFQNVSTATPVPAGDYLPEDSFSDFVGSDLNGSWCLEIVDNLRVDNGYIFEWGIAFEPSLYPDLETFIPQEVSQNWLPDPDVISTNANGTEVTVMPSDLGLNCYDYEFVDSFGCIYTEQVCVKVCDASIIPTVIDDLDICVDPYGPFTINLSFNESNLRQPDPEAITVEDYFATLSDAQNNTNPIGNILDLTDTNPSQTIFIRFLVDDYCPVIRPYNVSITQDFTLNRPVDLTSPDFDGDQVAQFDLTVNNNVNVNDPFFNRAFIRYFLTISDAVSNSNPIDSVLNFENTSNPQTIFMAVERYGTCRKIDFFDISIADNSAVDTDLDDVSNALEDLNNNGDLTDDDTDGDTIPNYLDTDDDGDTVPTAVEIVGSGAGPSTNSYTYIDTDGNNVENYLDNDDDGDGVLTEDEDYDQDGSPLNEDTNTNNIPDYLDNTVALSSQDVELSLIEIYPTLVDDLIFIDVRAATLNLNSISIFDLSGRSVKNQKVTSESVVEVSVADLKQGIYFIEIKSEDGNYLVKRFVKK